MNNAFQTLSTCDTAGNIISLEALVKYITWGGGGTILAIPTKTLGGGGGESPFFPVNLHSQHLDQHPF